VGENHQVLCVTHLPQIAAYADNHLRIEKAEREGRTVTHIEPLSIGARRTELAHMLGGTAGAEAALSAADARPGRGRERPRCGWSGRVTPAVEAADTRNVGDSALIAAIEGYLDYLRVERGLSPATISAYAVGPASVRPLGRVHEW